MFTSRVQCWRHVYCVDVTYAVLTSRVQRWRHVCSVDVTCAVLTSRVLCFRHVCSVYVTCAVFTLREQCLSHVCCADVTCAVLASRAQCWRHVCSVDVTCAVSTCVLHVYAIRINENLVKQATDRGLLWMRHEPLQGAVRNVPDSVLWRRMDLGQSGDVTLLVWTLPVWTTCDAVTMSRPRVLVSDAAGRLIPAVSSYYSDSFHDPPPPPQPDPS